MVEIQKRPVTVDVRRAEPGEEIQTREETLKAEPGDLIIEGVEGEVYPIGPEILAQTYVPVGDDALDLYRELLPPGVRVDLETSDDVTKLSGVYVDRRGLTDEEKDEAVEFARKLIRSSPHLQGDEVPFV